MKCLIFSDVHWNTNSSLIRGRGEEYSVRLEHLITSMNWINYLAKQKNCEMMICAGDMMDKSTCSDEEVTAAKEIDWNDLPCYFLCGNHESSVADLKYSTVKLFEGRDREIISSVKVINLDTCDLLFLPYFTETDRKSLAEYKEDVKFQLSGKPIIVISHNEIAGINYGGFTSKNGFTLDEIKKEVKLFLNGHLHNSEWVSDNALNLGSFSAHNFTNDSFAYNYGVWILDTETFKLEFIENPFGFNFYKLEINCEADFKKLNKIKHNSVLSVKCLDSMFEKTKIMLDGIKEKIIECRLTQVKTETEANSEISIANLQSDHLAKFVDFCRENISNTDLLEDELQQICR